MLDDLEAKFDSKLEGTVERFEGLETEAKRILDVFEKAYQKADEVLETDMKNMNKLLIHRCEALEEANAHLSEKLTKQSKLIAEFQAFKNEQQNLNQTFAIQKDFEIVTDRVTALEKARPRIPKKPSLTRHSSTPSFPSSSSSSSSSNRYTKDAAISPSNQSSRHDRDRDRGHSSSHARDRSSHSDSRTDRTSSKYNQFAKKRDRHGSSLAGKGS